jgi:hypothetical protein
VTQMYAVVVTYGQDAAFKAPREVM